MAIELKPLGTLSITVSGRTTLENTSLGTRVVGEASDCRWESERVKARQKGASASDWVLIAPDGVATLDARMTLETDDGAIICLRYGGRADFSGITPTSVIVAPTFETNDERYAWLNRVQAIAKGMRQGQDIVYELYEVR